MKNRSVRSGHKFSSSFGKALQRASLHRVLRGESLEARHMMAADVYLPFHNDLIAEDTNSDYNVSALDALLVINAINSGRSADLVGPGIGKADGPMIDVSGDNQLSPLDALKIINRLNGEGSSHPLVGFSYQFADRNGTPLSSNTVGVGELVQLKTFVQDLRGFDAKGVFTAFLDLDYTNGSKFQVNVGEVQSFRYFFDQISTTDTTSSFKFTFGSETTAPIGLFDAGSPRSAAQVGAAIQVALEALPSIGAGNVIVRRDTVGSNQDAEPNPSIKRNSYDIVFVNAKAGQDVPLLALDASNVKTRSGDPDDFEFSLNDKFPADPNNAGAVAAAFMFSEEFANGRTASLGNNQFDEIGALGGLGTPENPGLRRLLFSVTLKTLGSGTVQFTPNQADIFPAHDTLVFPGDVVPPDLISYGSPFNLVIVSSLVANDDAFTIVEDAVAAEYNVTANDTLLSGSSFTITSITASPNGGTSTISADGKKINYKPAADFFGSDTFTYTVTNNLGTTATATVTMTVTAVNDPITVVNKTASTRVNTPVVLSTATLTQNGSVGPNEASIQELSIASVVSPSTNGGTVTLSGGNVTYTPSASANTSGSDTFLVVITDNGQTNGAPAASTKTITVNVAVANDAPVLQNDSFDTVTEDDENQILDVLLNDSPGANDTNDTLIVTSVSGAANGTVTIGANSKTVVYTPTPGFFGLDTFTYTARDLGGVVAERATVTVNVQSAVLPRALNDSAVVLEDSPSGVSIDVLANDRTTGGSTPVLVSVGNAASGTVTINGNQVVYVPNANFSGTDSFTYTMDESPVAQGGVSSTATVNIVVTAVNDAPQLQDDFISAIEDTTLTIVGSTFLTNDSLILSNDSPGPGETNQQTLKITAVQAVSNNGGSVSLNANGDVVYNPATDFNGEFVFTYTAQDVLKPNEPAAGFQSLSGTATVTITVGGVNDAPILASFTDTTAEDTSKQLSLVANAKPGPDTATDESNQDVTVVSVSPTSSNGGTIVLAGDGKTATYTPAANFFGSDTFTFVIGDTGTPSAQATVTATINVTPVNDGPTVGADNVTAFKGIPLTISGTTLLANDRPGPSNENGQSLTITSVSNATNGSVELRSGGQVVFTPDAGYTGAASFSYVVTDNGQTNGVDDFLTASGTVNVTVQEFIPSSITGTVYVDETQDGVINTAERRLGGVTVSLSGNAFGQSVTMSYITLADGSYHFDQLAPGSYTVSFVNPTLMIDGKDTAGSQGDSDGIANNNAFGVTVVSPGGVNATGYNFGVNGLQAGYGSVMEKLASRYYAAGSSMSTFGLYSVVDASGSQNWFAKMDGFNDVVFAETMLNSAGTQVTLTIVDSNHDVYSTVLGKGKFITLHDGEGNTVIRVLGGREQFQFTRVDMSAPMISMRRDLQAIDTVFSQEGW